MNYGIKVSKPGKSVYSTEPRDFVMNSDWGTIKFLKWGAGTKTVNGSSNATETIAYTWAGQLPLVMIFVELTPGSGRWYATPFGQITGEDTYLSSSLDDSRVAFTEFTIKIYNTTASQKTVSYYYFVIGESGK